MSEQSNGASAPESTESTTQSGEQPAAAPAAAPPAAPETPAQERRRIKMQWEGREEEVDSDRYVEMLEQALGPEALSNVGGLAKLARTKVAQVGKREHQLRQAAEDLADPERRWGVLERIVGGREKLRAELEDFYARDLDERRLTPEERERRSLGSDIERMRQEKAALEQERKERETSAMREQLQPKFGADFSRALSQAGSEADPEQIAAMAAYVEQEIDEVHAGRITYGALLQEAARAVARRFNDSVAARLPKLPKDKRSAALREAMKGMSADEIYELLGEEGVRAFRKADLERVKSKTATNQRPAPAPAARPRTEAREKVSLDDFFKTIRKGDVI
jgi:hypothetical protein